ncbi:MAG TPA: (d)CMP kinase [Actinomycetota bacterium]|jgi:cytidylate kinase
MIIAIDGPAGAGKGTVARALAERLGSSYLDTGAMYRAIALAVLDAGASPKDEEAVERVTRAARIELLGERVSLNGVDVTDRIREEPVTSAVSSVAAHARVRALLVERQRREIVSRSDVVMEGRDIGTTVAPDADVKVFLTASLWERALRRCRQLSLSSDDDTVTRIAKEMEARDNADAARRASPFRKADDAIEIDSTGRAVADVVDEIAALVERAGRHA